MKFLVEYEVKNNHAFSKAQVAHILNDSLTTLAHNFNADGEGAPIQFHPTRVQEVIDRGATEALLEQG